MTVITPSAGIPYFPPDIIKSATGIFRTKRAINIFERKIENFFGTKYFIATNSGTAAFYIILLFLKSISPSDKKEVILPAYTAPSLILPIKRAGLEPKLADIHPETFNMDIQKVLESITKKTLSVLVVHMFGIPVDFKHVQESIKKKDVYVIEDAASSMGSKIYGKYTGTIAEIGFFSLNRGKNTSNLTGGLIYLRNKENLKRVKKLAGDLPSISSLQKINTFAKICGLSLAVRPFFYTVLNPLISKYKYTTLHKDFDAYQYNSVQSALGEEVLKRYKIIFKLRKRNGDMLYKGLKNNSNLVLPTLPHNAEVVFNQFPIVVKNKKNKEIIFRKLLEVGIETTFLYEKPLHHFYPELSPDRKKEPFPYSLFLAERLLLLPTHPQISTQKIRTIIEIVNEYA